MLWNPLYLNTSALDGYMATLEGGLRTGVVESRGKNRNVGGSVGAGPVSVSAGREGVESTDTSLADHATARLTRLMAAGRERSEDLGWIQVSQPDLDLHGAGVGAMVDWQCEVYIPPIMAALGMGDLTSAMDAMDAMAPLAELMGESMEGVPTASEMAAMRTFLDGSQFPPVLIAEDPDSDTRLVGSLIKEHMLTRELEGGCQVLAKVVKTIPAESWYPLLTLPGMSILPREERREMARRGPKDDSEKDIFIQGPALVVDYLAILR